jgi:hypothetical protein
MISVYLLLDFFSTAYRLFVPLGMFFYAIREKNRTFA